MLAFVLPWIAGAFSKGYHTFTVRYNNPFHVRLSKNLLVLALDRSPPPYVNFTVIDDKNRSQPMAIGLYTHLQLYQTTVFISVPKGHHYTLGFWLIPPTLCNAIGYALVADNTLAFDVTNKNQRSDFCLFTQSGAWWYSAGVAFQSDNAGGVAEFYSHPRGPAKSCSGNGKICKYGSMNPFFIRFAGVAGAAFSADVIYSATRWSILNSECALAPVPYMIEPPLQMPAGGIGFGDIKCVSTARVAQKYLIGFLICAGIAAAVLYGLHLMGYINLRVFCGCSAEKDRFNTLKENPYACQIEQAADLE